MPMTEKQVKTARGMLYICSCVLTQTEPKAEALSDVSLKELYEMSRFHSLCALVCEGLEQLQLTLSDEGSSYMQAFKTAKQNAIRKNLLLDTERQKLILFMEQNGIRHVPLKGIILKDMYPKIGLRQMSDNDILFDKKYRRVIRDRFREQGYTVKSYGSDTHDVYVKDPIYNYEMHTALCKCTRRSPWYSFCKNIGGRLVRDSDGGFGYHFTDEDFYIYFFIHGFRHFESGGIGIRFLTDIYVYLEEKRETLDHGYIDSELQAMGISAFEKNCRELTEEIFSDTGVFDIGKLDPEKYELLMYLLMSGTHGTVEQKVRNGVSKRGAVKYMKECIFPGTNILTEYHPAFRHKWLMPVGWVYRGVTLVLLHPDRVVRKLKLIGKAKKS